MINFKYKKMLISLISGIFLFSTNVLAVDIGASGAIVDSQVNNFTGDFTITSAGVITLGATTTNIADQGTVSLGHTTSTGALGSGNAIKALDITAATTTLGGAVSATTTTVSAPATLLTQGNALTGTLSNAGTVTLGSGATISGAITNTGTLNLHDTAMTSTINGAGTITSAQTHNTTAAIGDSTAATALNITANTFTLGATAAVTTTTISGTGTLSTGAHILTGAVVNNSILTLGTAAITGAISGTGTVNVIETYTAGGALGAANLNISATKTLNLNAAASTITGTTTINGSSASIVSNKDTDLSNVVIVDNSTFTIGTTYTLVEMTGSQLTVDSVTGPSDTTLINFTTTSAADAAATDKITVIREYAASGTIGLSGNNASTYTAATTAMLSSDTAVFNAMNAMNASQIDAAVDTMNPNTEGVSAGTINVSNYSVDTVSDHLTVARANIEGTSGISTGDESVDTTLWAQGFYTDVRQNDRGGVSGYNADGYGFVLGLDKNISKSDVIFGVALSVGESKVKSKNSITQARTDTNTMQVMIYATKEFKNSYLEGMLSYAHNENDGSRHVVVGAIDRIAEAKYDSSLMGARIGMGFPLKKSGFIFVPKASLNYVNLSTDTYTETGAGSMNLTVNTEDLAKTTAKAGVSISRPITFEYGGTLVPEFRTGLSYEMGDEFNTSSSTFTVGGNAFTTNGLDAADLSTNAGVGLSYISADKLKEFNINYDLNAKSGYLEQVGMLTVKYKF